MASSDYLAHFDRTMLRLRVTPQSSVITDHLIGMAERGEIVFEKSTRVVKAGMFTQVNNLGYIRQAGVEDPDAYIAVTNSTRNRLEIYRDLLPGWHPPLQAGWLLYQLTPKDMKRLMTALNQKGVKVLAHASAELEPA